MTTNDNKPQPGNLQPANFSVVLTPTPTADRNKPEPPNIHTATVNLGGADAPIVMMFGPGVSGKTVSLLRLAHYLRQDKNLHVTVDRNFREDPYYKLETCPAVDNFLEQRATVQKKPIATPHADFVAIDLIPQAAGTGRLCKFVELPGEHLFDAKNFRRNTTGDVFPQYVQSIFAHNAKKIIVFLMPLPDGLNGEHDLLASDETFHIYCSHVADVIRTRVDAKKDHFIFAITKADQQKHLLRNRESPNTVGFRKALISRAGFEVIKNLLKELNIPLTIVPFSAGTIASLGNNAEGLPEHGIVFGPSLYPKTLWEEIKKGIDGGSSPWSVWPFNR